jgi:hypothetical protein
MINVGMGNNGRHTASWAGSEYELELLIENSRLEREVQTLRNSQRRWEVLLDGMVAFMLIAALGAGVALGFWMGSAQAGGF